MFVLTILVIIGVIGVIGLFINFLLNLFFGDFDFKCLGLSVILTIIISLIIFNQFNIAYELNSYSERILYVEAVIDDRIIHNCGELQLVEKDLPYELELKLIGLNDVSNIKAGDIIKIKFLNGIIINKGIKIELVGNFNRK